MLEGFMLQNILLHCKINHVCQLPSMIQKNRAIVHVHYSSISKKTLNTLGQI